jgi:hypothetical protein
MKRRIVLAAAFVTAGLSLLLLSVPGSRASGQVGDHHGEHYSKCARACTDCQRECDSCAQHCTHLLAQGQKEHLPSLRSCLDCADICGTAAHVAARHGPLAVTICDGCAKACDQCGKVCEGTPSDEHMARCAKACRDCAKACRDMIQHVQTR